jgi:ABC-2 type transport system ATP-binding protein
MAIAGAPSLLVLDEPTAGMDVEARRDFWASMHAYAEQGRTILFATHYLEEAATSASRLVIIARGRTLVDGTVQEIQQHFGEPRVSFTLVGEGEPALWERFPGVEHFEIQGERVTLRTRDQDATVRALTASAVAWKELEVKSNDLEDTFLALVHEGKREIQ